MDRVYVELVAAIHLADLHREAEADRLAAAIPRRSPVPMLPILGRLLVRAGRWLEAIGQVCPDCPAPARA